MEHQMFLWIWDIEGGPCTSLGAMSDFACPVVYGNSALAFCTAGICLTDQSMRLSLAISDAGDINHR